ncbi:MAG TPA: helix-turn-helix domain-containing protein [Candidatus Kapabacteria bacterium]|nr:helix-turn-helix domain-containing protein [Candidatus Kapabacteria bacterium]
MSEHQHNDVASGCTPNGVQPASTECDIPAPFVSALTPEQRRVAVLFAAGKDVSEVADTLGVHRSTLWHWRKLPTFEAYLNGLLAEMQAHARAGLFALYGDAIAAVRRSLDSDNAAHALKAALFVLEHVKGAAIGETDPREIVKAQCTSNFDDLFPSSCDSVLDEAKYRRLCEEVGMEP